VARSQNISEETARLIDAECRRLVDAGEARAREVLRTRIDDLHAVAAALLEYETLTNDEVQKVLNREPIERKDNDDRQTPTASSVPVTKRPTRGPKGTGDMEPQPQA
jgi:cell division protease FtsH